MSTKRENRRIARVVLDTPLHVRMRSIGAEVQYDMETYNISYTGFFLSFEKPGRFPFTPSSIMEIWMQLSNGEQIFFNGKMARIVYAEEPAALETGPGIAIRIVQMEKEHEATLKDFVDAMLAAQEQSDVAS